MVNKDYLDHDGEIIEIKDVTKAPGSTHVKIKIKERISRRDKKRRFIFLRKVILILSVCILGLYVGAKAIERYLRYWKKPQMEYKTEEETSASQLKAGAVFSPAEY